MEKHRYHIESPRDGTLGFSSPVGIGLITPYRVSLFPRPYVRLGVLAHIGSIMV